LSGAFSNMSVQGLKALNDFLQIQFFLMILLFSLDRYYSYFKDLYFNSNLKFIDFKIF